ncbi:MAG TPA: AAA family ATPase [Tepidisphaeraceae bacterium]|nr:AAA family ATPase [Tepidisphaeraceae bacterium]
MSSTSSISKPVERRFPSIQRLRIKNYKNIAVCNVNLGALTVIVGRNGAGKSNVLDATQFVTDSVVYSPDHAIKVRGGIAAVRRQSTGHPRNFGIELEIELAGSTATYGFAITARERGTYSIARERLQLVNSAGGLVARFDRSEDDFKVEKLDRPALVPDRLALSALAANPTVRPVFDAITSMGFYRLNPETIRELQDPDAGELLHHDGSNLASVVARLEADAPDWSSRVRDYLTSIVPDIESVERVPLGPKETLLFRQRIAGARNPWNFYAASMSDGTLRAYATLIAVAQLIKPGKPVGFVGIEEPETALHPAAARSLLEALREASRHTQIAITTHSPDLLENVDFESEKVLAVINREGTAEIGEIDPASQKAVREHLYSVGELLRLDQLAPDEQDLARQRQLQLFDENPR